MISSSCMIYSGLFRDSELMLLTLLDTVAQYGSDHEVVILGNGTVVPDISGYEAIVMSSKVFSSAQVCRNICITASTGDIIIWIDDDIEVCEGYIDAFTKPFDEDPSVGIAGYECLAIQEDFGNQWFIDGNSNKFDYVDSPYAIRRDMVKAIGGYDEGLGMSSCDNTDLCLRAVASGWKMGLIENPGIKHYRQGTFSSPKLPYNKSREDVKSWEHMVRKYPPGWKNRYGLATKSVIVDEGLQFPDRLGRLGGPEDKKPVIGIKRVLHL